MSISQDLDLLAETLELQTCDASMLILPVSGGTDGALCHWLCNQAFPKRARSLHFGNRLKHETWFLKHGEVEIIEMPNIEIDAEALRWAMVASECLKRRGWPVGSRNRTEETLLTYSRPSNLATVLPIVGIWKSDVLALCKYLGVPEEMIESSRMADPACGRPQELAAIGVERIDRYLLHRLGQREDFDLNEEEQRYLDRLIASNEFKHRVPYRGLSLSPLFN